MLIRRLPCLGAAIAAVLVIAPAAASAQDAGRTAQTQAPARGPRAPGATRPALPPVGRGMNAMQLQQHLDAYALIQSEQQLKLTADQYAAFAPRLIRMQTLRRRVLQERRRVLNELNQLLLAEAPSDEAISEKTRVFDEVVRRGAEDLVKAYQYLDSALTPWQRGRFRMLEEQMERRKLELLTKLGPPAGPGGS